MTADAALAEAVAERLLHTLTARGVTFSTEGGTLRYTAPPGALDSDLVAALRSHKAELVALLGAEADTAGMYVESIALTVEMLDACWALADVSQSADRSVRDAAHARYQARADALLAWMATTRLCRWKRPGRQVRAV